MKKINIKTSKTETQTILEISGDLSLNTADLVKNELIEQLGKLSKSDILQIKLDKITNFDLSVIQLFISLKNTATKQSKIVKLETNLPQEIQAIINHAGFAEILSL